MKIALDAMGGDYAPGCIVQGALEALPLIQSTIILVGQPEAIHKFLPGGVAPKGIEIVEATQVVEMDEKPMDAIRKKRDSSLAVAINLVTEGKADAMVSAGNTGAATAGSLLAWRTLPGIKRPAILGTWPNKKGGFVILDLGSNPDAEPEQMIEFGLIGRAYAEKMMGRKDPKVHLLNIGEEPGKGSLWAQEAFKKLSEFEWFAGNIEGKDMFSHAVDVVVCDGFVGNIVLKTAEGLGEYIQGFIKSGLPENPIARLPYLPMRNLLKPLIKQMDYAEYGGQPLLGLNGLTFICHGRSNPKAIKNALLQAEAAIKGNLLNTIRDSAVHLVAQV